MKIHLPPKSLLSKSLALKAAEAAEALTKPQICDCIEAIAGVSLASSEKRQSKIALLQILAASVKMH